MTEPIGPALDDDELIGLDAAAEIAGLTPGTLAQYVVKGRGPERVSIRGLSTRVFRRSVVERWALERPLGKPGRPRKEG